MVIRQMVIVGGGEPELRCGMARRSMLSERVGLCMPMHYMHEVLSRMQCACVGKCEKGFVQSDWQEKLAYVKAKDDNTNKEPQV